MAALRDIARDFAAEIRDGIGWTIVYRTGRSWNALTIWSDIWNGEWETDDLNNAIGILKADPDAVAAVFDRGETVVDEPILYFYNPALVTSDFHESQIFVIEEGGHRFFAERSTR